MATERNGTHVFAWISGQGFVRAGYLVIEEEGEKISGSQFQYDQDYLQNPGAYPLDLLDLPLRAGRRVVTNDQRRPLFGGILDRLPDNWGQQLLGQMALELRIPCRNFDLIVAGFEKRIGALGFGPDRSGPEWSHPLLGDYGDANEIELEDFTKALKDYETKGFVAMSKLLKACLASGGSPVGGARPKALVNVSGKPVLAKFKAPDDSWASPCRIEYATMTLASQLGLHVPEAGIIRVVGRDVFTLERFDRHGADRLHLISANSLLGATQGVLGLGEKHSYQEIANALSVHGAASHLAEDREELFRRLVYNVLVNNADDHLRNHSVYYTPAGWRLTPLYDVMPDENFVRHHFIGAGSRETLMTLSNALSEPESFGLDGATSRAIVEEMTEKFQESWDQHFQDCGVSRKDMDRLRLLMLPAERAALEDDSWVVRKFYTPSVQVAEDLEAGEETTGPSPSF